MKYTFKGNLCAFICGNCSGPLSGVTIELYPAMAKATDLPGQLTASPKNTMAVLDDKDLTKYKGKLIGQAKTKEDGSFEVAINPKSNYDGGPIEIHAVIDSIPGAPDNAPKTKPVHIIITALQPGWRRDAKKGAVAAWNYCLPSRFWCYILRLFDVWVICGQVTTCDKLDPLPLGGLTVTAFDADWLQDDELGTAITDGNGHFMIYYTSADFKQTPFSPLINIEWTGGPDLFFKITASDGTVLLNEPQSRGRDPDREDVGNCFCVQLCVNVEAEPPYENPWFTHVGHFHINSDIDAASGLTAQPVLNHGGPDYGFFSNLELRGFCPKNDPATAQPMSYRFLFERLSSPGVQTPIVGNLVFPVLVGSRLIQWNTNGTGLQWTFQSIYIQGSGATPAVTPTPGVPPGTPWGAVPAHVIVPDANGWVAIDPGSLDGGFYGPLMGLRSHKAVPGGAAPGNGASNAPASPKDGEDLRIIFEAGPLGVPTYGNDLPKIHINNWNEVRELNLQQFVTAGNSCTPITNALDILYTADHELMAEWKVTISSAASAGGWAPPAGLPGGVGPRGNNGVHHENVGGWPSCSYKVWLTSRRSLTTGLYDDDEDSTLVTFCK